MWVTTKMQWERTALRRPGVAPGPGDTQAQLHSNLRQLGKETPAGNEILVSGKRALWTLATVYLPHPALRATLSLHGARE